MRKILTKILNLSKTETAKNTYILFTGNAMAAFLGMLSIILVSRKLGPAGFGVFSVSYALLALLSNLGDFGLNFASVKEVSQSRARGDLSRVDRIFVTVFWLKLLISFILGLLGLIFNRYLTVYILKSPQALLANKLVFLLLFPSIFYDLVRVFLQAKKLFKESALIYILANLLKLILIGLLIWVWPSFNQYILLYIATPFIAGIIFFKQLKIKLRFYFDKEEFKKLFQFASFMAISVILAAIGENLNIFMVSAKLTSFETGIYAAAEKFTLPVAIFTGALGTVFITRTSEFLELSHLKTFLKKVLFLQLLMLGIFLLAIPLANFLPWILGQEYNPSILILQILLTGYYFRTAVTSLNSVFYPLNKSIIFALDALIQLVFLYLLNQVFIPLYRAKGAAISLVIVDLIIFIFNYLFLFYCLKKVSKTSFNATKA